MASVVASAVGAAEPLARAGGAARGAEALDVHLIGALRGGAPLRRALARVVGALVCARAWEDLGFARLADYARERAGMSARELADLAHVDAALAALPGIEAAFVAGRLGWAQARLLCRVATPNDERLWLAAAERLSAAALAREVRAVDIGCLEAGSGPEAEGEGDGGDARERETLRIRCTAPTLRRWGDVRRLVRRVAGEWLPAEVCAELVAAEVLSAIRLEVDAGSPPLARRCTGAAALASEREAPAASAASAPCSPPSPFLASLLAALTTGLAEASPAELDRRLRRAAALERSLHARAGPGLLVLADSRAYRELGFRSLDAYARERLGVSPRKARVLLRIERACAASEPLRAAWREGRVSWCQAQALVAVVLAPGSRPFHAAWVERAAAVTVRRLEDDADLAVETGAFDPARLPALPVGVQIGAQATGCGATQERETWRANVPADVGRLFRACLCSVQRRLERRTGRSSSPGEALEGMFEHALATWREHRGRLPAEHRVFERDGWRCTVPGCSSYRNLHAHHVVFRSAGGGDALANLTTLCAWHHQRGVHTGLLRIHGSAPEGLVYELPVGRFRAGDVRA
jgi:hypothetical protein